MSKGILFIISGPSGSGKDSILAGVFKKEHNVALSISSVTRPMRPGEKEGDKYHFISREAFESMISHDELLEYNCFVGHYYGTPKQPVLDALEAGRDIFLEIDVNGAAMIRKAMPQAVSLFVVPPTYEELCRRLKGRGTDEPAVIAKRLEAAKGEISRAGEYDYLVTNDKLDQAVEDVLHIMAAERLKAAKQQDLINEVLGKC